MDDWGPALAVCLAWAVFLGAAVAIPVLIFLALA